MAAATNPWFILRKDLCEERQIRGQYQPGLISFIWIIFYFFWKRKVTSSEMKCGLSQWEWDIYSSNYSSSMFAEYLCYMLGIFLDPKGYKSELNRNSSYFTTLIFTVLRNMMCHLNQNFLFPVSSQGMRAGAVILMCIFGFPSWIFGFKFH